MTQNGSCFEVKNFYNAFITPLVAATAVSCVKWSHNTAAPHTMVLGMTGGGGGGSRLVTVGMSSDGLHINCKDNIKMDVGDVKRIERCSNTMWRGQLKLDGELG
jgi:hypothetical protein